MASKKVAESRTALKGYLAGIVGSSQRVMDLMRGLTHRGHSGYRSLQPGSGNYVVGTGSGFTSTYTDEQGVTYDITVHRRSRPKPAITRA